MIYNVKDYGALGNGAADDTSAIQAAVNAAHDAGGGSVYIPAGTYIVSGHAGNPSLGCIMLYSNVTVYGDGMGDTTVKLQDGWHGDITGIFRDQYGVGNHDITMHDLTIDGNRANTSGKIDGWFNGGAPGSEVQDKNITLDHVEIKDCAAYGFDPHEITNNLVITNSVSHGNGLDGFTLDYQVNAHIDNNIAYDNDRHGFNIVTSTHDIELSGNVAYANGGDGIMVQRGSTDIPVPHDIVIKGGEIYGNALDGVQVNMADRITVDGVDIHDNAQRGVRIRGSEGSVVQNSTLHDDSQAKIYGYDEIFISATDDTNGASGHVYATTGTVVTGNVITETGSAHALYSVRESGGSVDYTTVSGNTIHGTTHNDTPSLVGPHSTFEAGAANAPPVAQNDDFSTNFGHVVTGNVLADNGHGADSDPDGDPLSVTAFNGPTAHGTLDLHADGAFTYTPAQGFSGNDGFNYTLSDGQGHTAQAAVSVAVHPHAQGDAYDVRDFGAKGDGVTDDTAAIQAAVDAAHAAGGGTVYIPAGLYIVGGHAGNPSLGCITLYDNVTVGGDGMGQTVVKLKDGWSGDLTGIFRDTYGVENHDITLHDLTIDGNRAHTSGKIDGWFNGVAPEQPGTDTNITLDHVEIMNCLGYGFDPHEITTNLTITNSVSHGNGLDGFTLDYQVGAHIDNNIAYGNDRHGFNIVTTSHDMDMTGNVAYGNGADGILIQRGSTDIPAPHDISIKGGEIYGNALDGIQVNMSDRVTIDGVDIHDNGQRGIRLRGSADSVIENNTLHDNSQSQPGGFDEIALAANDDTNGASGHVYATTGTQVLNNTVTENGTHALYSVRESGASVDYTTLDGNHFSGTANNGAPVLVGAHSSLDDFPPGATVGSDGSDTLKGDTGDNVIYGLGGNDDINGGGGNDTLYAGAGNDNLAGGGGNDILHADAGNNVLHGNSGNDVLYAGPGTNALYGDSDDDLLVSGGGSVAMTGGSGADVFRFMAVTGTNAVTDFHYTDHDKIDISAALQGYDVHSSALSDFVRATSLNGSTVLSVDADGAANGSHFTDLATLQNVAGFDVQAMAAQGTLIVSADGAPQAANDPPVAQPDSFNAAANAALAGNVLADNGSGADSDPNGDPLSVTAFSGQTAHGSVALQADGSFSYTPQSGFAGQDGFSYTLLDGHGGTAQGSVSIGVGAATAPGSTAGTAGDDTITGTSRDDVIYGLGGNDTVNGGDGNDQIYGGDGNDALNGGKGDDILRGEGGNNVLHGNSGADTLYAGPGADILYGESDNDLLVGGSGSVTMSGGSGADVFKFTSMGGANVVTDFHYTDGDKIDISNVLHGYDPAASAISDFVHATSQGGNTVLSVDADGAANGAQFADLVTLQSVSHFDVAAMAQQGYLVA